MIKEKIVVLASRLFKLNMSDKTKKNALLYCLRKTKKCIVDANNIHDSKEEPDKFDPLYNCEDKLNEINVLLEEMMQRIERW